MDLIDLSITTITGVLTRIDTQAALPVLGIVGAVALGGWLSSRRRKTDES